MLEPPPAVRQQMFFLVLFINVLNVWVLLVLSEPTLLTQVRPSQESVVSEIMCDAVPCAAAFSCVTHQISSSTPQ